MKKVLLLSILLLFSCQSTKRYLQSNDIDCDCIAIILEMQNTFYKIDEERNLYSIRFKSKNKEGRVHEYKELLKKYTMVANNTEQKCMKKLNKKMVEDIFGAPTERHAKAYIYYLPLHPRCIKPLRRDGTGYDYSKCNYLEFDFFEDGKVKWIELEYSLLLLQI